MSLRAQRACIWCGPVFMVLLFLGFGLIAGFIPPPSPQDSPDEVAEMFREDTNRIRLGLIIASFGATLLAPWYAVMAVQLKRIEGRHTPWTYTYVMCGAATVIEFLIPQMTWQTAAYRPDESSPEFLQKLNDLAWLPWLGITTTATMQGFVIAFAVFGDRRPEPIFPRWYGYLCIWSLMMLCPSCVIVFFKDGPFAWNGAFAWWVALIGFSTWVITTTVLLLRAVAAQEADGPEPDLATEVAELRARLDRAEAGVA